MMNRMVITLLFGLLATLCFGQNRSQTAKRSSSMSSPIRRIDFRNFTFPLAPYEKDHFKAQSITARNGKYDNEKSHYEWRSARVGQVIYGDLTGDGREEALVPLTLEWIGANPANSSDTEFYIFTIRNDTVSPLVMADEFDDWTDYTPYRNPTDQCDGWIWGSDVKIERQVLKFNLKVGGRHCVDNGYDVTMKYRWNGSRLILIEKPLKRKAKLKSRT